MSLSLDEFVTKYNGKVVADGQCGNLVRAYWNEVDLTSPPSYPNSKDYWYNPVPGYDKVQAPQPGDIAIYDGHGVYTEGHSAIYYDGRVFEQNADPNGSPAHLYPRANTYLLGYLHKQGGDMPTISQEEYDDLKQWKATFQPITYSPLWAKAGGAGGSPKPDAHGNFTAIIEDDAKYADWVKGTPAWQASGADLTTLDVVKKGSGAGLDVKINGVQYVEKGK